MQNNVARWAFLASLVLLAAASRIFQPYSNFTAIGALAVISALLAPRAAYAFILTWAGMLLGDVLLAQTRSSIGWSPEIHSYIGMGLITLLALGVRKQPTFLKTALVGLAGGAIFFIYSNGMVWADSVVKNDGQYSFDLAGLTECYINAIPFYRPQLLGDAIYLPAFYAAMCALLKWDAAQVSRPAQENS